MQGEYVKKLKKSKKSIKVVIEDLPDIKEEPVNKRAVIEQEVTNEQMAILELINRTSLATCQALDQVYKHVDAHGDHDWNRWLAIGQNNLQIGFMALRRAVVKTPYY